mgnify:CR=1 FL=1
MKIRIQGNSIRLRLAQQEVADLSEHGSVDDCIAFGPNAASQHLVYRLVGADVSEVSTHYGEGCVTVQIPQKDAQEWVSNNVVGFENDVPIDGADSIRVVVEKDFKCLEARPGEEDLFPNPHTDASC